MNSGDTGAPGNPSGIPEELPLPIRERWLELVASEARFRALYQYSPCMINSFGPGGEVILWNHSCERILGYSKKEISQVPDPMKLFYPDPEVRGEVERQIRNPDGKFREFQVRAKSGAVLVQMWANFTLPDRKVISVGHDITEMRNAQEKLRAINQTLEERVEERTREVDKQRAKLVSSAKFVSLGEMAAGVAHEINNPLAIVAGHVDQLVEMHGKGMLGSPQTLEMLSSIRAGVNRITKIISGLRAFTADVGRDRMRSCGIQALLKELLDFCWERFRASGIDLQVELPGPEVKMQCRPVELQQVVLNLLNNAFDAVQGEKDKWVRLEVSLTEGEVEIAVTDSGHGLSEEVRRKIFQPFFTTKELGKGTGLGLSISKGIVESHGGQLFYVAGGPHTRFVARIPRG